MLSLAAGEPFNFNLIQVLSITISAALVGIAVIVGQMGKGLDDDPEVQERKASREIEPPATAGGDVALSRMHASEESVDPDEIMHLILAPAILLRDLARPAS